MPRGLVNIKNSDKYIRLISFIFFSTLILLVYDLFNEVEKRGEVTSARNFPRIYRTLLLGIAVVFYYSRLTVKQLYFNKILICIFLMIIINTLLSPSLGFGSFVAISKILYLLFVYLCVFKYFSFYGTFKAEKVLNIFVAFSVLAISLYLTYNRFFSTGDIDARVYGDNNSYILLSFLPLVYLNNNLKQKRVLIFFVIMGVFLGLKRGAMLGLFLCLPVSFILEKRLQVRKDILTTLRRNIIIVISIGFFFFLYTKFENIFTNRFQDFTESGASFGSGRGDIYSLIWNDWYDSNDYKVYLIGKGYGSVQALTKINVGQPLMAHSDVFNFIHSYGLLGILLLLGFLLHQIKIILKLYKWRSKLVIPYFMIMIIFLLKAVYSGNFETPNFVYMLIGYSILNVHYSNLKKRVHENY